MNDTTMPAAEPRCIHCGATYEETEKVAGEPAGFARRNPDECAGGHCIAKRAAAGRIAGRLIERTRRDAVAPISARIDARRKAKQERKAKRSRIAAERNNRMI